MNIRRLRYFVTLAEELHFGRAAVLLHVAQPALTQNVQQLEAEFGIPLFTRSSRRVELTEGGRVLLEEAQRLLIQASSLQERMRAFATGQAGHLRLNYARSASGGASSAIVEALRLAAPGLRLEINSQYTAKSIEDLLEGRLDAAFIRSPLEADEKTLAMLQTMPIDTEPFVVALPRAHRLTRGKRIRTQQLVDEPVVTGSPSRAPGFYRAMFSRIWGEYEPRVVKTEPDEEHMVRSVAAGLGLSILTQSRAKLIQMPGVVIRQFVAPEPRAELALAWMANNQSAALAKLVSVAKAYLCE